jgi:hypothetical protein
VIGKLPRHRIAASFAALASLAAVGVSAPPALADGSPSGAFVVGDTQVVVGGTVTFWGAQWWKDNPLSSGLAPAAFKGFADDVGGLAATCGRSWSTRPGNSSAPPASLTPEITVIVASHVVKHGSVISGDTTEVALVQPNPGYAPDPGHAGTGTVTAILCSGTGGGGGGLS